MKIGYGFRVRRVSQQQYVVAWEYVESKKEEVYLGPARNSETWQKLSAWLKERGEKAVAEARVAVDDIDDRARVAETEAIGNGHDKTKAK